MCLELERETERERIGGDPVRGSCTASVTESVDIEWKETGLGGPRGSGINRGGERGEKLEGYNHNSTIINK